MSCTLIRPSPVRIEWYNIYYVIVFAAHVNFFDTSCIMSYNGVKPAWFALLRSHDILYWMQLISNTPFTIWRSICCCWRLTVQSRRFRMALWSKSSLFALQLLLPAFGDSVRLPFFILAVSPAQAWSQSFLSELSELWIMTILADSLLKSESLLHLTKVFSAWSDMLIESMSWLFFNVSWLAIWWLLAVSLLSCRRSSCGNVLVSAGC